MAGGALSAGTVSLAVHGDTNGFGKKVSDDIKGQSSTFGGLGKHLGGLIATGLGAVALGAPIAAILKTGFDEAKADELISAQFAAGIKSTGNAANLTVKGMNDLSESISRYSGQSDESIGKTEQVLQTFTAIKNVGVNNIFDQATVAAANMAAKLGGDASGSAIQLGKALQDPVKGITSLRRVGVAFTQAQTDQVKAMVAAGNTMGAQKLILAELNTEFGGAAQAAGETLPGAMSRSKVGFEMLSKSIVGGVFPAFAPVVSGFAGIENALTDLVSGVPGASDEVTAAGQQMAAGMTAIGPAIQGLVGNFGTLFTALAPALQSAVTSLVQSLGTMLPSILTLASGIVTSLVTGIAQAAPGLATAAVPVIMTLVGSLIAALPALLTAAAQVLAAIATGIAAALPTLIPAAVSIIVQMVSGLIAALPTLLDAALQLIQALAQGVLASLPVLIAALPRIITSVIGFLVASLPVIIQAGIQLFTSLIGALPTIIQAIVGVIPLILNGLITFLSTSLPMLIQAGLQLFMALVGALPAIIEGIVGVIPVLLAAITGFLVNNLPTIIDAGIQLFTALIGALPTIISAIVDAIPTIIKAIGDFLGGPGFKSLVQSGVKLFLALVDSVSTALPEIITAVVAAIPSIVKALVDAIPQIIDAGGQLIGGLLTGMIQAVPKLLKGLTDSVLSVIPSGIKKFFGISSPSKMFRDEIGMMLGAGMAEGITGSVPMVQNAAAKLATSAKASATGHISIDATTSGVANMADKVGNGSGPQVVNNIYEATSAQATAYQVTRLQIARGV